MERLKRLNPTRGGCLWDVQPCKQFCYRLRHLNIPCMQQRNRSNISSSPPCLLTLGSMLVEWISRTITEEGFGQGSTLIICMGILISCSQSLQNMVSRTSISHWGPASGLYVAVFLIMTMCAVLVTEGRRTIKLQFYGFDRFPSTGSYGAVAEVEPYIPFDINPGGMLPVLMSSYLLALPGFLARFINTRFLKRLNQILNPTLPAAPGAKPWLYHGLNAVFIFLFSVLEITDGAKDISEYINRIGARIQDVKPGRSTILFLRKVQNSARSWGGILLALLVTLSSLVDYRLRSLHQTGGSVSFTSMLFIVSRRKTFCLECHIQHRSTEVFHGLSCNAHVEQGVNTLWRLKDVLFYMCLEHMDF